MAPKNLLLIKGYGQPHPDRWQAYEARYAKEQGLHVAYPEDIPDFEGGGSRPTVQAAQEFILDLMTRQGLEPDRTIVLAHSLGGNLWMRILESREDMRACLSTLIATPKVNRTGNRRINDFFPTPNLGLTEEQMQRMLIVGSNNDKEGKQRPHIIGGSSRGSFSRNPEGGTFYPTCFTGG